MKLASSPKPVALIIDDESQMRRVLGICLESNGYRVLEAPTGREGIARVAQNQPDVVILDLSLPDMEGVAVLQRVREWSRVPVVVLSVRDRPEDKIAALDQGADDYVTKPFGNNELLARLRLAQRQASHARGDAVFRAGELEVDLAQRLVKSKGREVKLTPREYALLKLFVRHPDRVLTYGYIMREVWGPNSLEQTNCLRVYMAQLRGKLEVHPADPALFLTVSGVGYRLAATA